MKVNGIEIIGENVAYDSCHKLYVCEDEADIKEAEECEYSIYPLNDLPYLYDNSCDLKFINNWKLDKTYCGQFEEAVFTY